VSGQNVFACNASFHPIASLSLGDTGLWLDYPGENTNLVYHSEWQSLVQQLHSLLLDYIQLK
jgi:hypothetical protein